MLHSIGKHPATEPAGREPLDLLLSCHARLRHFSELSLALATHAGLDDSQVVDAAHRLLRYFRVALPLHEADEEETIAPALAALVGPVEIDATERMRDQHRLLHDMLAELFPCWETAEGEPRAFDPRAASPHALRLSALLDVHLEMEESIIFPTLRRLGTPERERLFDEMRGRRSIEVRREMQQIMR